jgi:ribonuclease Z
MEPIFHHRLLNSSFEDPCLFVRILRERRSMLFDVGDIGKLSPSEIYRITDLFVTHTHIDHFIGFDTVLRAVLRRENPLNVYGPPGIAGCVEGKLKGYSWNLIREYPTVINVFSYNGRSVTHSMFKAENGFRKEAISRARSDGFLLKDPLFTVRAAVMDNGIPCLAYAIEEDFHINIDKDRLLRKGLHVGPWLSDLKKLIREKPQRDASLTIAGKRYRLSQLLDIASVTKGQKISFATDLAATGKNIEGLIKLAQGSDVLYCEAYFLEEDRDRASGRFHLTARTCGLIAKEAGVKNLVLMHFSPKYRDCPDLVINEAMAAFSGRPLYTKNHYK